MKKTIGIILTLLMMLTMTTTAFAADKQVPGGATCEPLSSFDEDGELLVGNNMTRSLELPTTSFNLAEENYTADLQIVGKHWLYTNKYFHPNGESEIHVDYNVTADKSTTYLYIGLYDLTKNELVVESEALEVRTTGKTGGYYFYNLTNSHNYAICFRADPSSLNGSAVIRH